MSKKTLSISEEYDFGLIGISSHTKDYRLCWELNQLLGINLVKQDNISSLLTAESSFPYYTFDDQENHVHYHLIGNKSAEGYFSPERKQVDFFLMLTGDHFAENASACLPQIMNAGTVLTAFEIDVKSLKSKDNFVLE